MSFVIVFLIDDPPRLVIDIFLFQWIRGTFIFKSRYCVTRPRSLLVRNVASRYDPWPHFFFLRSRRSTRILSALGERGAGKRKRRELSRGWIAFSKRLGVELDRKSADRFVSRAILSPRTSGRRNFCRSRRGEWFSICAPFEIVDENDSVGMSDSMLKFFQREDCIWGIDRNLIIYKL